VGGASPWAEQVRSYLDAVVDLKVSSPEAKRVQEQILANIIESIQAASSQMDIETNLEVRELEVPEIQGEFHCINQSITYNIHVFKSKNNKRIL
jgi:hypothetical protein